jgi:glyoxylase-like metal-dependent hydrolase (beta-lactamase superfamily II)
MPAMGQSRRKRELGRGERVLPGVWRLRLPLPWPGVPHVNAFAVRSGEGIVLFDTGMATEDGQRQLELALAQVGYRLEDVRLVVCTHAHTDHYGLAAPIVDRAGCELWMHPAWEHIRAMIDDPDAALDRRIEVARQSGVPAEPLRAFEERRKAQGSGVAGWVEPDRDAVAGVTFETDHGRWSILETPGHAPSHICLHQPERRVLLSGDHLLGRVSLYYDYGWTPDPAGEFLASLAEVDALDARLCLSGHGRPFTDVRGHVRANQALVAERTTRVEGVLQGGEPRTAYEIIPEVYETELTPATGAWWLAETLCYLTHLERAGRVRRVDGEPERWRRVAA